MLLSFVVSSIAGRVSAAPPDAAMLFPKDTAMLFHVSDVRQTLQQLNASTYGDILRDPSLQPLVSRLREVLGKPTEQLAGRFGTDIATLSKLSVGQVSVGLVSTVDQGSAFVGLIDIGESKGIVNQIVERLEIELLGTGADFESRKFGEHAISLFRFNDDSDNEVALAFRDNTLLFATKIAALEDLMRRWDGNHEDGCLDQSTDFRDALRLARVERKAESTVYLYAHPLDIYRTVTAGNLAAQASLALVPVLGLDGVRGIGANLVLQQEPFDSVLHVHVVIDKERQGVIKGISLKTTEATPEDWVPDDVASYQSFHWDFHNTIRAVRRVWDDIQGEGAFDEFIDTRMSEPLGIDLERDVVDALTGDFVRLTWYEPMAEPTGDASRDAAAPFQRQSSVLCARLAGRERFEEVFRSVVDDLGEKLVEERYGETIVYTTQRPVEERRTEEGRRRRRRRMRNPQMSFALFRDYLLVADRIEPIERIIDCDEKGASLNEFIDFQTAVSAAKNNFGGGPPMSLTFTQVTRVFEYRWSLVKSEALLDQLRSRFESNATIIEIIQAIQDHPLPAWETLAHHVAPSISVAVDGENGLHYTQYRLRPDTNRDSASRRSSKTQRD